MRKSLIIFILFKLCLFVYCETWCKYYPLGADNENEFRMAICKEACCGGYPINEIQACCSFNATIFYTKSTPFSNNLNKTTVVSATTKPSNSSSTTYISCPYYPFQNDPQMQQVTLYANCSTNYCCTNKPITVSQACCTQQLTTTKPSLPTSTTPSRTVIIIIASVVAGALAVSIGIFTIRRKIIANRRKRAATNGNVYNTVPTNTQPTHESNTNAVQRGGHVIDSLIIDNQNISDADVSSNDDEDDSNEPPPPYDSVVNLAGSNFELVIENNKNQNGNSQNNDNLI